MASFNVTTGDKQNLIVWITGTEIDTEGFHILRSTTPGGSYSRITRSMIVSTGSPFSGGRYSFVDSAVEDDNGYYYKLEEVDTRGNLAHYGPALVTAETDEKSDTHHSAGTQSQVSDNDNSGLNGQERVATEGRADGQERKISGTNQPATVPAYTVVAYADGMAKFLSGEAVDEETVQAIRSRVLEGQMQESPPPAPSSAITPYPNPAPQRGRGSEKGAWATPADDVTSPSSLRFMIIDADGNEVAVVNIDTEYNLHTPPFSKGGILEDAKSRDFALQKRQDGDRIILTWYAAKPVKGFHILRSTTKDGPYQQITKTPIPYIGTGIEGVTGQIFRFTYTDRNVQKGKDYYYSLEIISKEEGRTAQQK